MQSLVMLSRPDQFTASTHTIHSDVILPTAALPIPQRALSSVLNRRLAWWATISAGLSCRMQLRRRPAWTGVAMQTMPGAGLDPPDNH